MLSVLFVLSAACFLILRLTGKSGTVANIYVDGELYKKIDLDAVAVAYDIEIRTEFG